MTSSFSNADKVYLVLRQVCLVLWLIPLALLHSAFVAWTRGLPLRLYLICAVLNLVLGRLRPHEIQYLCDTTQETYRSWMQVKTSDANTSHTSAGRLGLDIEPVGKNNCSLLWVGNRRTAKKVVLFFHGGGFITPLLPGHLEICSRVCVDAGVEMGTEVAVAVLEYTLYPAARHPVRLCQAASALSHLLSSGFLPQDIIIGGDSAGGCLAAQLLCHLVRPHPEAEHIQLSQPLAAVFLISPWLTRHTNDRSFTENNSIDMISATSINNTIMELVGPADIMVEKSELASRAFPLDKDVPCFEGLGPVVKQMYVAAGQNEVFRDQISFYVRQVQRCNPGIKMRFDLQPKLAHDFILLEGLEGRTGECMEAMKEWMKGLLAEELY
ncbi:hypothetical protein AK830_g10889 [Neonectria ditissima]|uniref:Alpha/beta hydrolase fold-3 domain-containing protein n=1 Tax=Neonectria ditissima TaxID=78410 RepID=A0A0P7B4R8_9HYPO|nr:hypothetical protein AK830_g10889 [Neonectria ditissima]